MKNKLFLRKEIYSIYFIEQAISDYRHICTVDIENTNDYYICAIKNAVTDLQLIMNEFEDYLIGLIGKNEFV